MPGSGVDMISSNIRKLKLSQIIRLIVQDCQTLDRDLYMPMYSVWHHMGERDRCLICLGGAYIACQQIDPTDLICSEEDMRRTGLSDDQIILTFALEYMRTGGWNSAHYLLGLETYIPWNCDMGRVAPPEHEMFVGWSKFDLFLESFMKRADELEVLCQ